MNQKVIKIPSNQIIPAGRSMGIEPGLLSALSGFPTDGGACEAEKEWEEVLPVLLSPSKVSMLMKGDRDHAVSLTSLSMADEKLLLYSGEAGGNTYIREADPVQLQQELLSSLGSETSEKEIVLPMSLDALFTLSALADITKQQKARMMLGQVNEPVPPKIPEIQKFLDDAVKGMDPRWCLTPFLYSIYGLNRTLDVPGALKQLQEVELVEVTEGNVYPTERGFLLLDDLTSRRGIVGFHSYYFEGGRPVQSTQVLLDTWDTLWLMECGSKSVLTSLNTEAAKKVIEDALKPGESIPAAYVPATSVGYAGQESGSPGSAEQGAVSSGDNQPVQENVSSGETQAKPAAKEDTGTWICSCGKQNNGNFCISCGKPKATASPDGKQFCRNCGSEQKQDAQFCVNCCQKF